MLRQRLSTVGGAVRVMSAATPQSQATRVSRGDLLGSSPLLASGSPSRQTAFNMVDTTQAQLMNTGGIGFNRYLTGIAPEGDQGLIFYYRDCYDFDSVAGATVDMQTTYPFSEWTLVGLDKADIKPFQDCCTRLDIRSLMAEATHSYLVDGAFISTLVHDGASNSFKDLMIHDWSMCRMSPSPFYTADPIITVAMPQKYQQYINDPSPYVSALLQDYPKSFLTMLQQGSLDLDPMLTIFVPRRGNRAQETTSYLRRVLPAYFMEKALYRGTLLEFHKRMRSTTHIQMGTDTWQPTPAEMQATLGLFQQSEMDPLGAWVVTRQGVQIQDIRTAGDFLKFTDIMEQMVPYKLRALGVSEAFLSGEASYATAETAMTVFTENAAALRSYMGHLVFNTKLFPLIAVTNKLYKDPRQVVTGYGMSAVIQNLQNTSNLKMPTVRWNKTLDNHDPNLIQMLDTLSQKGIPVPLKMWAAASNVSIDMLLGDLEEDEAIKKRIEKITGKKVDVSNPGDGGDMGDGGGDAMFASALSQALNSQYRRSRRKPLLSREFAYADGTPMDTPIRMGKTGKVHAVYNEKAAKGKIHDNIVKAAKALADPHHREQVRKRIVERMGGMPNINPTGRMP